MKLRCSIIVLLLAVCAVSFAQPAYSPEVRAERELKWMQDSLQITSQQAGKLKTITLDFERRMDKANQSASKTYKKKTQKQLMSKKDAAVKSALNSKSKYQKYYRREKEIRRIANITYPADRQPL